MVLCECACANLILKANLHLLDRTDLFIRLHILFQISFQSSKGQKSYHKFLGVRSELLLSIDIFNWSPRPGIPRPINKTSLIFGI